MHCYIFTAQKEFMASIKYNLKSGTSVIYIFISHGRVSNDGFQVRKSIDKKVVNSKNWLVNKEKVRECKEELNAKQINRFINQHRTKVEQGIIELSKYEIEVSRKAVINIIDNLDSSIQQNIRRTKFSFCSHLKDYVLLMESGKKINPVNAKKFSKNTVKAYKTLINNIHEFESCKRVIKPHQIDYKLYEDLLYFFRTEVEKKYTDNYIGSIIKRFKAFVKNYLQLDLNLKLPNYNPQHWKKPSSETLKTYLTLSEIRTLLHLDLSEYSKEYDNVRDAYCFIALSCGLRVGDYMRLNKKDNITTEIRNGKEYKLLTFKESKNDKYVKAPIPNDAYSIIIKNNGFPRFSSEQKSNKILKELGKLCQFNQWVEPEKKNNHNQKKRKYELMTNHTARRSFCTNAYDLGTDLIQIMKISGHSSPDILLEYINKTLDEYADKMTETPYYKAVDNLDNYLELKAV